MTRVIGLAFAIALVAAACGDDLPGAESDVASQQSSSSSTSSTSTPNTEPEVGPPVAGDDDMTTGTVDDLAAASDAVVQIVATGEFASPGGVEMAGQSSGTGFIVSGDGLAITNNHVVTGAAFLEVFVPGEEEPRRAEVLGVSECSDLAAIDIEGDGYPSLAFRDERPRVGTEVFAAGYPLGDPEFTLTDGIVSKAQADGVTPFSAIDSVLEHTATINPGNSGGPLLSAEGEVIAVNYAGNSETEQYFGIAALDALPIIDQLRAGNDVDSVGLSGEVIELDGIAGLFIESVATGSPGDRAGVHPGDLVVEIEGVPVGAEGTMRIYCETLRNNGPGDELAIEILRPSTGEVLSGNLNGPSPLAVTFTPDAMGSLPTADGAALVDYVTVVDDSNQIRVEVPAAWADVSTGSFQDDATGTDIPAIVASPDIDTYLATYTVPGMFYLAFPATSGDPTTLLDRWAGEDRVNCQPGAVEPYDDGFFVGVLQVATECGAAGASSVWVAAGSLQDPAVNVVVSVQALNDVDIDVASRVLATFDLAA